MDSSHADSSEKVLAKALALLRDSGFTAAAAKLEKDFDSSAPDDGPLTTGSTKRQTATDDVTRTKAGQHRQVGPCSASSLESCGVLSGPIASSGHSQFPSPSQGLASSRQESHGGQHSAMPSPGPSSGHRNASRGAQFEIQELGGVVVDHPTKTKTGARRSPYHLLPHNYFFGQRDDSAKTSRDENFATSASAPLRTSLPAALLRYAQPYGASPADAGAHRRSHSEHHHSVTPSEVSMDSAPARGKPYSSGQTDGLEQQECSATIARQSTAPLHGSSALRSSMAVGNTANGSSHALPWSASASSLDAELGNLGDSGSMPHQGPKSACSAPVSMTYSGGIGGSTALAPFQAGFTGPTPSVGSGSGAVRQSGMLRSHDSLRRSGADDSAPWGDMVGEANDPPDAPEDEQSFMHDLTHHAWRLFTKHVAKEAASLSGSSVQTAQQAEAAHGRASVQAATPHTVRSVASHPSARHDVLTAHTPHSQHQLRGSAATSQPSHLRSPALAQLTSPFQSAPHVQNVEPNVLPLAPAVSAPSTTGGVRSPNAVSQAQRNASTTVMSAAASPLATSASAELFATHSSAASHLRDGAEAGLNLHGLPSNQKPAEAAGQSSGIDRSGSVRSLDASVGATGGLFNSSMSDLSGAFNGASSDLLANQGLFSASRADTQTQMLSPPGTPPPDADEGSAWDSCHESVSVAGRSAASEPSIDATCGAAGLLPGASDADDSQHISASHPASKNTSCNAPCDSPAVTEPAADEHAGPGTIKEAPEDGSQVETAVQSLDAGDAVPEVGAAVASSQASVDGVAIRREASLCIDVGGTGSSNNHWSFGGPRHTMVPSTASSGSFHADRFASAQAADLAVPATNSTERGTSNRAIMSQPGAMPSTGQEDSAAANFTAWRSVSEPVGDHQLSGSLFMNKWNSDTYLPMALSGQVAPGDRSPAVAPINPVATSSSAFATAAAMGTAAVPAATPSQAASSPSSPSGMFGHIPNLSFSSQRRSSESGAGPMAWQPSQQSLQGNGSVTAAIPDSAIPGAPEATESMSSGGKGSWSRQLLDAPGHPEAAQAAVGAMQRGADAVGNIAGQIFGKAAQYTSDWYSKKIAKSGSVSTLSLEGDSVDGGTPDVVAKTSSPLKERKDAAVRALLSGLRRGSRQPSLDSCGKEEPVSTSNSTTAAAAVAGPSAPVDSAAEPSGAANTHTEEASAPDEDEFADCEEDIEVASLAEAQAMPRDDASPEDETASQSELQEGARVTLQEGLAAAPSGVQDTLTFASSADACTTEAVLAKLGPSTSSLLDPAMRCSTAAGSLAAAAPLCEPSAIAEGSLGEQEQSVGRSRKSSVAGSMMGSLSHGEEVPTLPPLAPMRSLQPLGARARAHTNGHDADDEGGSEGNSGDESDEAYSLADKAEGDTDSVVSHDWPSFKLRKDLSGRSRKSRGSGGTGGGGSAHSTPRSNAPATAGSASSSTAQRTGGKHAAEGSLSQASWADADSGLRQSFTLLPAADAPEPSAAAGSAPGRGSANARDSTSWKGLPALDLDLGVAQQGSGQEMMPLFSSRPSFDSGSPAHLGTSHSGDAGGSDSTTNPSSFLLPTPAGRVPARPSSASASEHTASERASPFKRVAQTLHSLGTRVQSRGRSRRAAQAVFPWREPDVHGMSPSSRGSASDDNPVATAPQPRPDSGSDSCAPHRTTHLANSSPDRGAVDTPANIAAQDLAAGASPTSPGEGVEEEQEETVESEPSAFDLTECEADSADGGDNTPFLLDLSPHNVAISDADSPTVGGTISTGGRRPFLSSQAQPSSLLNEATSSSAPLEAQDRGPLTLGVALPANPHPSTQGGSPNTDAGISNPASIALPTAAAIAQRLLATESATASASAQAPSTRPDIITAHPSLPTSDTTAASRSSRPTQRSINVSSGEPDLAAALHSPRHHASWSPPHAPFPILPVMQPSSPSPPNPSGDGGFLPLDDKPEEDDSADESPVKRADGLASFHPSSDALQSTTSRATEGASGYLTEPFPNSPDTSFQLQPFPSSSGPLDEVGASDSVPLRQPDAISNSFSAPSGSCDLKEGSARLTEQPGPQVAILGAVEPLTTRRSSSANPSSPSAVQRSTHTPVPPAAFSLPSVSTAGSPTPLAVAAAPATGSSPTAAAGLMRPLQPLSIITAPSVGGNSPVQQSPAVAAMSLAATAAVAAEAANAAAAELAGAHSGHLHGTATSTSPNPNWARVLMDGPSHFSSLQSSPAFSQRSPSALAVTPTGSSSSLMHRSFSPIPGATPSGATTPASPVPPGAADYDPNEPHECLWLPIFHRSRRTGLEGHKEFVINIGDVIAQRYTVTKHLGHAAFSRAVAAVDAVTGMNVCLKVIRSNKDFLDQSLDEIKLLQMVNQADPDDQKGIVRLNHFFYWREHLVLATELLHLNLYQCCRRAGTLTDRYFTMIRVKAIAKQVLRSLVFLHSLDLIHCDLKPENIMIADFELPRIKIIDLGSSCFRHDRLATYVQSRSYRAPEVILKAGYDGRIDVWSLGAILVELVTGNVLFAGATVPTMLARISSICGPLSTELLATGRVSHHFYTRNYELWERDGSGNISILKPAPSSVAAQLPEGTEHAFIDFLEQLLKTDPAHRPTAEQALQHPWLSS